MACLRFWNSVSPAGDPWPHAGHYPPPLDSAGGQSGDRSLHGLPDSRRTPAPARVPIDCGREPGPERQLESNDSGGGRLFCLIITITAVTQRGPHAHLLLLPVLFHPPRSFNSRNSLQPGFELFRGSAVLDDLWISPVCAFDFHAIHVSGRSAS